MIKLAGLFAASILGCHPLASLAAGTQSDRERAGLTGPVRTVTTAATPANSAYPAGQQSVVTYDQQGNEIESATYHSGLPTMKSVHTYGAGGQRTDTADYSHDGTLSARTIYDAQGRRSETAQYSSDGSLSATTTYRNTFGTRGERVEQSSCSEICFGKTVSTYDAQGNLVEEVTYYPDVATLRLRVVHAHDAQGRRTATRIHEAHDPGFVMETYDAQGNVIERAGYSETGSPTGTKTVLTHVFDSKGNWVKQTWLGCSAVATGERTCSEIGGISRTISYFEPER